MSGVLPGGEASVEVFSLLDSQPSMRKREVLLGSSPVTTVSEFFNSLPRLM